MDPKKTTIFLVEDDSKLRESLSWFLGSHGYQVIASSSTSEALKTYNPNLPGCLVLDLQLPEGTGLDLYKQFGELGCTHPFIMMTAYSRVPLAVEAMRLGAVDFLEKPFENTQLLNRIQEAVAKDKKSRQLDDQSQQLLARLRVLAPREWQVAKLVTAGQSSKDIARTLDIKRKTVETHRHNILTKLGVESSTEVTALVTRAQALQELGLIELPE